MNTILISGASGLLASEFIKQLFNSEPNTQVIALSNSCDQLKEMYQDASNFSCYSWDELDELPFKKVSLVLHCAFARSEAHDDLLRSLELTSLLLRKTAPLKIPFISISSRGVYGQNPDSPWSESTALAPNGSYAMAKATQELLVRQAGEMEGFAYTNLRLAGLIGIGMDARLIAKLVKSAVDTGKMSYVGGMQQFALLDIRDAAAALLALIRVPADSWEKVYNLGHNNITTLDEVVTAIKQMSFQQYHQHITVQKQNREIPSIDGMDCARFFNATGWEPQYTLMDTVTELFDYYGRVTE